MYVTETNEQAFDVAERLSGGFPRTTTTLFVREDLPVPAGVRGRPNLVIARKQRDLPAGPSIVVANAAKWSWVDNQEPFDTQIVDEAFQLPDYRYHQIAGLARKVVQIGDPGQIRPVVTCNLDRWRSDGAGPHVPCPKALLERHPDVLRMVLPVSRRLVQDTVDFVQPAFYPDLQFRSICSPGERTLRLTAGGTLDVDAALELATRGASLVELELPARVTGEVDDGIAATIVTLVQRLIRLGASVIDDRREHRLGPDRVGVVCAHVSQVHAVQERLPRELAGVLVETSDRFQGLERDVMIVHHPLSGRVDASDFHLDAGRLCVMLSRHRVACFIVMRARIPELLERHAPQGDRALDIDDDPEYDGWRAHGTLLRQLRAMDRVVPVNPPA